MAFEGYIYPGDFSSPFRDFRNASINAIRNKISLTWFVFQNL